MILLSEIDHRRVLDGARVPLCWHITDEQIAAAEHPTDRRLLEDTRNARIEWCGDIGWRDEGAGYPPQFFREPWGAMAIDPAHPDVARVLDQRIAEALPTYRREWADNTVPWYALLWQMDYRTRSNKRHWSVAGAYANWGPDGKSRVTSVPDMPCLAGIPLDYANIPAARAALIRALYPKETP